jgi:hypothetical protein
MAFADRIRNCSHCDPPIRWIVIDFSFPGGLGAKPSNMGLTSGPLLAQNKNDPKTKLTKIKEPNLRKNLSLSMCRRIKV